MPPRRARGQPLHPIYALEELSNEEAAEILGEPVSAIKSRLHRARMALREQLTRLLTADAARPAN